jgi:hypothetical protein
MLIRIAASACSTSSPELDAFTKRLRLLTLLASQAACDRQCAALRTSAAERERFEELRFAQRVQMALPTELPRPLNDVDVAARISRRASRRRPLRFPHARPGAGRRGGGRRAKAPAALYGGFVAELMVAHDAAAFHRISSASRVLQAMNILHERQLRMLPPSATRSSTSPHVVTLANSGLPC